jgi:hypothetical protein
MVEGLAVDEGAGISRVEISFDGTKSLSPNVQKRPLRNV